MFFSELNHSVKYFTSCEAVETSNPSRRGAEVTHHNENWVRPSNKEIPGSCLFQGGKFTPISNMSCRLQFKTINISLINLLGRSILPNNTITITKSKVKGATP
eukprot:m.245441 g.245441  ORF g.245441 m.245441 type:complete len:103 (+) comp16108_c1_seq15:5046-5354(+)